GNKGITAYYDIVESSHSFTLANYLVNGGEGCTVTDDGVAVDINTKADYFGKSYLRIKSNRPYIERQPESVDAFAGDEVVFKIKAENATRYVWYICDADDESEQPYSWEDLKQYYDISGENTDTLVIRNVSGWFDNKKLSCTVYNDNGRVYSQNVYLNVTVRGDVNSNGVLGISDIVMMKKYLVNAGELTDWELGDVNNDGIINVFDLCLMRCMLLL
ncbi:MAG: dockerin type I domain-containing protein, partial [Oscillospiraceae bacterium]|nr:dockerin type I domain-containing protein [Oscillospiraceae bacterium]